MIGLTARARELLVYLTTRELCPSFEEMQTAMGYASKSPIHRLLTQLEERGYIRRLHNRARAIEILRGVPTASPAKPTPLSSHGSGVVEIPLYGRINEWSNPSTRKAKEGR